MLSRFWAQWFKVWSVLSDTALWASTTSSYGIQVIHKRLSEMSYLLQIPPSCGSASPLLILPELHHLPSLCSSSDQSIIFAPIFVFFFRSLWFFLFFFIMQNLHGAQSVRHVNYMRKRAWPQKWVQFTKEQFAWFGRIYAFVSLLFQTMLYNFWHFLLII